MTNPRPDYLVGNILRIYDKGQQKLREIHESFKSSDGGVAAVNLQADLMQTNHLQHLEDGILDLTKSNDKAVELLNSVDKNIAIMADRAHRV